jgi:hypothetical protein
VPRVAAVSGFSNTDLDVPAFHYAGLVVDFVGSDFHFSVFWLLVFVAGFCPKKLGEIWGKGVITLYRCEQPDRKNP